MSKKAKPVEKIDFEKAMAELEKIVDNLESGTLTLDESIAAFERGIELSKLCRKRLETAEDRVKKLLEKSNGEIDLEIFEEEDGSANG
jgi:exodeoxyribonuclease VII small subunit